MSFIVGCIMIGVGGAMISQDKGDMGTLGALWILIGIMLLVRWVKGRGNKK